MLSFSFPSIVCLCLLILTNVSYLIWAWIDCSFSWIMFTNVMTYYLSTFVLHRLVRELYSWIFFLNTPKVNILMHNCCNLFCRQFIFTQIHNLYLLCFTKLLLSFISIVMLYISCGNSIFFNGGGKEWRNVNIWAFWRGTNSLYFSVNLCEEFRGRYYDIMRRGNWIIEYWVWHFILELYDTGHLYAFCFDIFCWSLLFFFFCIIVCFQFSISFIGSIFLW